MVIAVLLVILLHVSAIVISFTAPKDRRVSRWFYAPALAIVWLAYIAYETMYIPRHCPGECNIRVDLVVIYPYLLFVTISALVYFARRTARK
jgi:FtsH-binding integral membrane protein